MMLYLDLGEGKIPQFRKGFLIYQVPRFVHGLEESLTMSMLYKAKRIVSYSEAVGYRWYKHRYRKQNWFLSESDRSELLFWKLQSQLFIEMEAINGNSVTK